MLCESSCKVRSMVAPQAEIACGSFALGGGSAGHPSTVAEAKSSNAENNIIFRQSCPATAVPPLLVFDADKVELESRIGGYWKLLALSDKGCGSRQQFDAPSPLSAGHVIPYDRAHPASSPSTLAQLAPRLSTVVADPLRRCRMVLRLAGLSSEPLVISRCAGVSGKLLRAGCRDLLFQRIG